MRQRSLRTQLVLGGLVGVLALVGLAVVVWAILGGIEAVRSGDAVTAAELTLVALGAVAVPVFVIAVYAHWLDVTTRPRAAREAPPASWGRKAVVGIVVTLLALAGRFVVPFVVDQVLQAWDDLAITRGILFGLGGLAYLAFTFFCIVRYLRWVTQRR
jgi:hypothetical protein